MASLTASRNDSLLTQWIEQPMKYDGSQLSPLFSYRNFGLLGSSCIGFCGPCDVSPSEMVDLEDLRAGSAIRGSQMLHFIVEIFDRELFSAVCLQRLLAEIIRSTIEDMTGRAAGLWREGDDLYRGEDRKLSISIATSSTVSQLIHFAVNISNEGTPVATCSLEDFGIPAEALGRTVLAKLALEYESLVQATRKVRPV
ncbi:MAG: DUF366 domain-containing protein [Bdellovibrio sp.]|nr:MAG: DUF366 domain-containing protein [Bdellovibrio sp.]